MSDEPALTIGGVPVRVAESGELPSGVAAMLISGPLRVAPDGTYEREDIARRVVVICDGRADHDPGDEDRR